MFSLIIVRVGLGLSKSSTNEGDVCAGVSRNTVSAMRFPMRTFIGGSLSQSRHVIVESGDEASSSFTGIRTKYTTSDMEPSQDSGTTSTAV